MKQTVKDFFMALLMSFSFIMIYLLITNLR
jgi:hypothetical protein